MYNDEETPNILSKINKMIELYAISCGIPDSYLYTAFKFTRMKIIDGVSNEVSKTKCKEINWESLIRHTYDTEVRKTKEIGIPLVFEHENAVDMFVEQNLQTYKQIIDIRDIIVRHRKSFEPIHITKLNEIWRVINNSIVYTEPNLDVLKITQAIIIYALSPNGILAPSTTNGTNTHFPNLPRSMTATTFTTIDYDKLT